MQRVMVSALAASIVAAISGGCGESNGLSRVYGQVNYKGEPAAGATVSFHRTDPGAPQQTEIPQAEVGPDGSFRLDSGDLGSGATPGHYAVLVEWRQGPLRTHRLDTAKAIGKAAAREGKPLLIADDRLKGRYHDIGRPRLEADVKPGSNTLPPFELAD